MESRFVFVTAGTAAEPDALGCFGGWVMLAEILRRREVRAVTWFHADHWEPWGMGVNGVTTKRVARFAQQAAASPIASKMTLFYLSGTNYRLRDRSKPRTDDSVDEIIQASVRPDGENDQVREMLGELQARTGVEFQFHLHHEHLVGSDGDWNELHRAVKSLTDPLQDEKRIHYLVRTELERLRRDTGLPFEKWAFVHGMWALNGSDRTVCQIDNEISILMEHGCWGDFTFPAGRYHCDPTILEQPYTCRPFKSPKAYDDPRCEPIAVDVGAGAIQNGRFLIWNSKAKHSVCSVDYYHDRNADRLKQTDHIAFSWLANCPVIDGVLYIKTHAHSMDAVYYEEDNLIPLVSPDVEAIFRLLQRACDEAKVELRLATVDEVFDALCTLDGRVDFSPQAAASSAITVTDLATMPLDAGQDGGEVTPTKLSMVDLAAVSILQKWIDADPQHRRAAGNYYTARLEKGRLFVDAELMIAEYSRKRFGQETRFFELGFGFGELSLLLAVSGFGVTGFESDNGRYAGATALAAALAQQGLDVGRLSLVNGSFPDALQLPALDRIGEAVLVSTNVTSSYVMEKIDYVFRSLRLFDHLIADLSRFGETRDERSRLLLIDRLSELGFVEIARIYSTGDTDVRHFGRRSAPALAASPTPPTEAIEQVRLSDLGSAVPRRFLTAPNYIFKTKEVPLRAVLPRLPQVPRAWLPAEQVVVSTIASAFGGHEADSAPILHQGPEPGTGTFAFPRFGGHRVNCSYGVFKCLTLDPAAGRDQHAIDIFRFAAENIVHSCVDKAVIVPWAQRTRYIRPDLLLAKLFQSDQPLALHCDHASQVTAYLLHLSGYRVREISVIDPAVNSGHVVMEVFLPEQARWVMLDPDFGVVVRDHDGMLVDVAQIVACKDREGELVVERVVEKRWTSQAYNVAEAFGGQLVLRADAEMGRPTVSGDSYYDVMKRCFRARVESAYRFEEGFEDNRVDALAAAVASNVQLTEKTNDGRPVRASSEAGPAAAVAEVEEGKGMQNKVTFDPFKTFKSYFKLAGSVVLDACPVCEGRNIAQLWRLPQSRFDRETYLHAPGGPHHNTYLHYMPLLKVPQEVYSFDICADCHSIFRNPKEDDQEYYKRDTSKVRSYKEQGIDRFRGAAATCEALFPPNTRFVVDAACGAGQILAVYKEQRPDLKLFGLELSAPSVDWMKEIGIPSAVADLDLDDLDVHVAPGTVDFIVFNEAFEHVRSPLRVMRKMFRMLRPGGRIHFTAQYFGPENGLQIRVGEPIYIDRHGLDWVIGQLGGRLIELKADVKYHVTLEKV